MEFSRELRESVLSGGITVSFRLWRRVKVREGGRYPVGDGQIEVDSVEVVPFSSIDADDVRRAGEADLESLRRRAAHAGPIGAGTLLFRIEFHALEPLGLEVIQEAGVTRPPASLRGRLPRRYRYALPLARRIMGDLATVTLFRAAAQVPAR